MSACLMQGSSAPGLPPLPSLGRTPSAFAAQTQRVSVFPAFSLYFDLLKHASGMGIAG